MGRKVGAPRNNKNAEKWTFISSTKLMLRSIEISNDKEGDAYKYDFIGEVACELGIYHDLYIHLIKRFPSLSSLFKQLKYNMERNCYTNTKKGNIKEATGIVNLKSNHHWKDRHNVEVTDFIPPILEGGKELPDID